MPYLRTKELMMCVHHIGYEHSQNQYKNFWLDSRCVEIFPLVVVEPSHNKLDLGVYGGASSSTSLLFITGEILPEREIKNQKFRNEVFLKVSNHQKWENNFLKKFVFARSLYLVSSV